jgi:hypothetical protein
MAKMQTKACKNGKAMGGSDAKGKAVAVKAAKKAGMKIGEKKAPYAKG